MSNDLRTTYFKQLIVLTIFINKKIMQFFNFTRLFDLSALVSLIWLLSVKEIFIFNEELLILGCFLLFIGLCFFSTKQLITAELSLKANQFKDVFDSYVNITHLAKKQKKLELQKNNILQTEIQKLPAFFMNKIQKIPTFYKKFLSNLFVSYINELYYRLLNINVHKDLTNQIFYLNNAIFKNLDKKFNLNKKIGFIKSF